MANELVSKYLYIDTSVFEYRQFDLKSNVFTALLELAKEGNARLLTSAITTGECHAHIKAHVGQASTVRNTLTAKARILKRFEEYAVLFEKPDKDKLSNRLIAELDQYLLETKAEHLDLDDASVANVVNQYFSGTPPFGFGDKKAEFPDAIVISALTSWCELNSESVYLITRDKGMRDACGDDGKLVALEDIKDFLDLVNSHEEIAAERIRAVFRYRIESLTEDVKERFHYLDFDVYDHEGADVEIDEVRKVEFGEPEIIAIDENEAKIEVECEVAFTADITYEDTDTGVWDGEDKVMLFMDTVHGSAEDTASVAVEILCNYDELASLANADDVDLWVEDIIQRRTITLRFQERHYDYYPDDDEDDGPP